MLTLVPSAQGLGMRLAGHYSLVRFLASVLLVSKRYITCSMPTDRHPTSCVSGTAYWNPNAVDDFIMDEQDIEDPIDSLHYQRSFSVRGLHRVWSLWPSFI